MSCALWHKVKGSWSEVSCYYVNSSHGNLWILLQLFFFCKRRFYSVIPKVFASLKSPRSVHETPSLCLGGWWLPLTVGLLSLLQRWRKATSGPCMIADTAAQCRSADARLQATHTGPTPVSDAVKSGSQSYFYHVHTWVLFIAPFYSSLEVENIPVCFFSRLLIFPTCFLPQFAFISELVNELLYLTCDFPEVAHFLFCFFGGYVFQRPRIIRLVFSCLNFC